MRVLRTAAGVLAVALFTLTGTAADAGGPPPVLKVAKPGGSFQSDIEEVNIPNGKAKTLTFKVKNTSSSPITAALHGTGDAELQPDYRIRWFRGSKNITDKMTDEFEVTFAPGTAKTYEAKVKHRDPPVDSLTFCLELRALGLFPSQFSTVGINSPCT